MSRWVVLIVFLILGVAAGLAYGWLVSPVQFVDTTPASLRVDYRADYVLMIAERFHADRDPAAAYRHLSILGGPSPEASCAEAISFARSSGYSPSDLQLLEELSHAMQSLASTSTPPVGAP